MTNRVIGTGGSGARGEIASCCCPAGRRAGLRTVHRPRTGATVDRVEKTPGCWVVLMNKDHLVPGTPSSR